MALAQYETSEQSLDRERKKFSTHVDTSVSRFRQIQDGLERRRVQEAQNAERERQQGIRFERNKFVGLVTPTLDRYANDRNAEADRIDGERSRFRDLIGPTLEEERGRIEGIETERSKFSDAVGPQLEVLRTPTATATPTPPERGPQPGPTPIPPPGFVEPPSRLGTGIFQLGQEAFEQANRRVFEPTELVGGRAIQAVEPIAAAAAPGLAGPVGLAARGAQVVEAAGAPIPIPERFKLGTSAEQVTKLPGDIQAAANAAVGDEEDSEILRQRLTEIGLPERIVAGVILDPLNLIPGLGLTSEIDTLRFLKGLGNIRRGAGLGDEAAEYTVSVLRRQTEQAEAGIPLAGATDDFPGPGSLGAEGLEEFEELAPAAERLTQYMSEQGGPFQTALKERSGEISESLSRKTARMQEIAADTSLTPQQRFRQQTEALAGKNAEGTDFPAPPMTSADAAELLVKVEEHPLLQARVLESRNTKSALVKLLDGELPQKAEWKLLERVFGADFVRAGAKQTQDSWRVVADLLNLPRTLRTIFDHSWPLRQGIGVLARHPKEVIGNLPKGLWSMVSDRSFRLWDEALRTKSQVVNVTDEAGGTKPWTLAELQDDSRLFLPKMDEVTGELAERTEEFLPTQGDSWVSRFFGPVVEPFQRSFIAHGNMARSDIFENTLQGWTNNFTVPVPRSDVDALSWLLNVGTGRGDLGGFNKYSPFLAGGIFSPRLLAGRVEHALSPILLASGKLGVPQSGRAANLAAQQLVSFIGAGVSLLTAASLAGVGRVELDPRSSLWGKIELFRDPEDPGAPTQKIDLFGGYQQYARVIAQLMTEQGKSDLGVVSDKNRARTIEQFGLNKIAPVPSLAYGAFFGETTIGTDVDLTSPEGIVTYLWDGLSPLSLNDIVEAVLQQNDPWKLAVGVGTASTVGSLGAGANTYSPRLTTQLNAIPEFKGLTAQQVTSMKDLLDYARQEQTRARKDDGVDLSMAGAIRGQGADRDYEQDVINVAVAIQSTATRDALRNPEWVAFAVENLDELMKSPSVRWLDPPNYIIDLWRRTQGLGVPE